MDNPSKEYFVTEDGRRVEYLDNPLPGPKSFVHRKMRFDHDGEDDFDFEVSPGDDFDID